MGIFIKRMKKKVYIETTIPSYLAAKSSRDITILYHQEITKEWWNKYKDNFELYISEIVFEEASRGDKEYSQLRVDILKTLNLLDVDNEIEQITNIYINHFSFPKKSIRDASHIAYSVFYKMDFLLTWNCRHLANAEIRSELAKINNKLGFPTPDICTPLELIPPDIKIRRRIK